MHSLARTLHLRAVFGLGVLLLMPVSAVRAESASVQVRESLVRSKPLYYAPSVTGVRYGDRLELLSDDAAGWTKVRLKGVEGFLPTTSITSDVIVLSSKQIATVKADPADVVLAGKGFSKEVEQEYQKRDRSARFDLVNQVERATRVSSGEMTEFLKSGELRGR